LFFSFLLNSFCLAGVKDVNGIFLVGGGYLFFFLSKLALGKDSDVDSLVLWESNVTDMKRSESILSSSLK